MTKQNTTLDWYYANAMNYARQQYNYDVESEIQPIYDVLDKIEGRTPRVLDFGCGCGRDTKSFLNKGYYVCSVDGSSSMITEMLELLKNDDSYNPRKHKIAITTFDRFLKFEQSGQFDAIWCMASLVHLETPELENTVKELYNNYLNDGGIMYMSFKAGTGESKDVEGRFYNYMSESKFRNEILTFPVDEVKTYINVSTNSVHWYNAIIRKAKIES